MTYQAIYEFNGMNSFLDVLRMMVLGNILVYNKKLMEMKIQSINIFSFIPNYGIPVLLWRKKNSTSKTTYSKSVKVEIEEEETVRRKLKPLTIT